MKASVIFLVAGLLAALVSASPAPRVMEHDVLHSHEHLNTLIKRNDSMIADKKLFIFVLFLELIEAHFYIEGLKRFKAKDFKKAGYPDGTFEILETIRDHEIAHVKLFTEVLGKDAIPPCKYDFGYKDLAGFLVIARALEGTGVSGYDGAVSKIVSKEHLTVATTIATTEGRHSETINFLTSRFSLSGDFDIPLNAVEVFTIAGAFVKSCPFDIGIKPHPRLTVIVIVEEHRSSEHHRSSSDHSLSHHSSRPIFIVIIEFIVPSGVSTKNLHCAWLHGSGVSYSSVKDKRCSVPSEVSGNVYLFVTKDTKMPGDSNTVAGPAPVTIAW